jgi:protein-tyrosine-phosphatase
MTEKIYNVLFLCTGNSARSIMAESILNREGAGRFHAFSAGSYPKRHLHAETVNLLTRLNYDLSDARSKSWDEFAMPDAPNMDFVFTVCDSAAGEVCPIWPGHPMTAHWGVPDPAAVTEEGAERALRIAEIYRMLHTRIAIFVNLRIDALDRLALQKHLAEIGKYDGAARDAEVTEISA